MNIKCVASLSNLIITLLFPLFVLAGSPVFTLTPVTPTAITLSVTDTVLVNYMVTNQSSRPHTLVLKSINGINQVINQGSCPNPFYLGAKQSCMLQLQVVGTKLNGGVHGGPLVCQKAPDGTPSPLQCYQPSLAESLNITVNFKNNGYFFSGAANGQVYFSNDNGAHWSTTMLPPSTSAVNSVFATSDTLYAGAENGNLYYSTNRGTSWQNTTIPDGSAINSVFVTATTVYVGTRSGNVLSSTNNGKSWKKTTQPDGSSVNSIFVSGNAILYAGTANGTVSYSNNGGSSWSIINSSPDGSAIHNVFATNTTLYVDTANEYVYTSAYLTGGGTWTPFAQTVYSLFVNADGSIIYAGTAGGYVFSLSDGTELGFVEYTALNSIFLLQ